MATCTATGIQCIQCARQRHNLRSAVLFTLICYLLITCECRLTARHATSVKILSTKCTTVGTSCTTLARCSNKLFHRCVASPWATTPSQSPQLLAFGTVCYLTSSRRHCWSPSNDGSRHCSSAARLISDGLTPVLILHGTVDGFMFFCG